MARILKDGLAVRDARDEGTVSVQEAQDAASALGEEIDKLLAGDVRHPPNVRLLKHIGAQRDHLFTFLTRPGVDATNFRAEQGIRPAVVTRKVWGGNRTWRGAHVQEVLCSVLQTCRIQRQDALAVLIELLCSPVPHVSAIAIEPERAPPR